MSDLSPADPRGFSPLRSEVGIGAGREGASAVCRIQATDPGRGTLPVYALDAGALGMMWTLWLIGIDVLPFIRTDELLTLDAVDAFDGYFGTLAPNRVQIRKWMPRLEAIALDVDGQGRS
jgi:hypothetical protein